MTLRHPTQKCSCLSYAFLHLRAEHSVSDGVLKCGVDRENNFAWPTGHSLDIAQDAIAFHCKLTWLAHVQFLFLQKLHVFLHRAALYTLIIQSMFSLGLSQPNTRRYTWPCWIEWVTLPSNVWSAPLSLVSSTNLLRIHLIPLSMSLKNMLNAFSSFI